MTRINLHPHKISIETFSSGIDHLCWVHFPKHRTLRTVTKRRMCKRVAETKGAEDTKQSHLELLKHRNTYKLQKKIIGLGECF